MRKCLLSRRNGKRQPANAKNSGKIMVPWSLLLYTFHVNVMLNFSIKEFKKRRWLRLRQRQKAVILLVKRTKMIVLHVRHAFLNISLPYSSKLQREMTKFKVLTTTWTNYSESFSLTLYFKSVRTNPVLGHVAHIA